MEEDENAISENNEIGGQRRKIRASTSAEGEELVLTKKLRIEHHERKSRTGFCTSGPFLGFEDKYDTPTQTGRLFPTLDLDHRFFPDGIQMGQAVEVKGPENCGKTFLLTYFLARFLQNHPTKKAVLINTSHQFNIQNLVSILVQIEKINCGGKFQLNSSLLENQQLNSHLDRLIIINCNNVEEFYMTVLHEEYSHLKKLVMHDLDVALVAVDTVDNYSFTEAEDKNADIEVVSCLKKCVDKGRTPIICTTIRGTNVNDKPPQKPLPSETESSPFYSNIRTNYSLFSHSLTINPASRDEKKKISERFENFKGGHYATAYLRSKHKANMAGSVVNHRVKFSIFSDMLWIDSNS